MREPRTEQEFSAYYDLRWRILREPWTRARESARDERECDAFHVIAVEEGNRVVGAGRLHFNSPEEAQVRYMAVETGRSGAGIGSRILEKLEAHARDRGARRIVLNARENAIPFYRKHGYQLREQTSTEFEAVVHWRMIKDL